MGRIWYWYGRRGTAGEVRPARYGRRGAAGEVWPARCGRRGAAGEVRPIRCGEQVRRAGARVRFGQQGKMCQVK